MRKLFFIVGGLAVVLGIALLAVQRQGPPPTLEGLYDEYYRRGPESGIRSPFNGVVLVARGDEIVFNQAYGRTEVNSGEELSIDARFLVGANAKPFTAVLALQQVGAGALDLGATVARYLPEFPDDISSHITLHQLLSHTSGLPRDADADEWDEVELRHEPGTEYGYSNFGYELVTAILESVTGKEQGDLLDEGIVVPLGLANTGFAGRDELDDLVTPGWSFRKHEFPVSILAPGDGRFDKRRMPRAGGVYTNAADMLRFIRALQSHELLTPELTETMLTPGLDGNAYGWFRNHQEYFVRNPAAPLYSHHGRIAGHNTVAAFYDDGTTAIVLANVDPLGTIDLLTSTYLAAHGVGEATLDVKHPSLSNRRAFRAAGGVEAFYAYYDTMSERAGYPIEPSSNFCAQVVRLLIRGEEYDEASSFVDTVLERWPPQTPGTLNGIGYAFLGRDRFEESIRVFRQNIELFPEDANARDSLGEAYERKGDLALARESYTQAVEIARANNDRLLSFYERRIASLDRTAAEPPATP